jgi:hypothetical protein
LHVASERVSASTSTIIVAATAPAIPEVNVIVIGVIISATATLLLRLLSLLLRLLLNLLCSRRDRHTDDATRDLHSWSWAQNEIDSSSLTRRSNANRCSSLRVNASRIERCSVSFLSALILCVTELRRKTTATSALKPSGVSLNEAASSGIRNRADVVIARREPVESVLAKIVCLHLSFGDESAISILIDCTSWKLTPESVWLGCKVTGTPAPVQLFWPYS